MILLSLSTSVKGATCYYIQWFHVIHTTRTAFEAFYDKEKIGKTINIILYYIIRGTFIHYITHLHAI